MPLDTLKGYQRAALKAFTADKVPAVPGGSHPVLGSGAAFMALSLWTNATQTDTDGIFLGLRIANTRQLYYLDGWRGRQAYHMTIFGKTGAGKSTSIRALLAREAEQGTQIVLLDPQPHIQHFAEMLQTLGVDVVHHKLSPTTALNPLDIAWTDPTRQANHVRAILKIMLSPDSARVFSAREVAALNQALLQLYDYNLSQFAGRPDITPTLDMLCRRLYPIEAGRMLAEEIDGLYVSGILQTFNAATAVNARLDRQVVVYDFSEIFADSRASFISALYYYITLSAIYQSARSSRRRQIIFVDEFGAMMRDSSLAANLAVLVKTARTFNTAIWAADQNPFSLAGLHDQAFGSAPDNIEERLSIIRNAPYTLAFMLDAEDAKSLQALYPNSILRRHVDAMTTAPVGVGVLRNDFAHTDIVRVELKPIEARYLTRS